MKSLEELNQYALSPITYIDDRPARVFFDRGATVDQFIEVNENTTYFFPYGIDIEDITQYDVALVEYEIDLTSFTSDVVYLSWPNSITLPAYITVSRVGNYFTISGIRSASDWDLVKAVRVQPPFSVSGFKPQVGKITWFENALATTRTEARWDVQLSLVPVEYFGPAALELYTSNLQNQQIAAPQIIVDPDEFDPVWTLEISPSVLGAITEIYSTNTSPSETVWNNTTKTLSITGDKLSVNDALLGLEIDYARSDEDFVLNYLLRNNFNLVTENQVQFVDSRDFIADCDPIVITSGATAQRFRGITTNLQGIFSLQGSLTPYIVVEMPATTLSAAFTIDEATLEFAEIVDAFATTTLSCDITLASERAIKIEYNTLRVYGQNNSGNLGNDITKFIMIPLGGESYLDYGDVWNNYNNGGVVRPADITNVKVVVYDKNDGSYFGTFTYNTPGVKLIDVSSSTGHGTYGGSYKVYIHDIGVTSPRLQRFGSFPTITGDYTTALNYVDFHNGMDMIDGISGELGGSNFNMTSIKFMANGCNFMTKAPKNLPSTVTDCSYAFSGVGAGGNDYQALAAATLDNVAGWDVSNVTDMSYMFAGAPSFNADISGWDVSSVTDMKFMFSHAISFSSISPDGAIADNIISGSARRWGTFNQDISGWDVSNVTNMTGMFAFQDDFNQDLGDWDVSNVTLMTNMFNGCRSFNSNISTWVTTSLADYTYTSFGGGTYPCFNAVFKEAESYNQPMAANTSLGYWDVSGAGSMRSTFHGALVFDQNISNWDVSNVTDSTNFDTNTSANWTAAEKPSF